MNYDMFREVQESDLPEVLKIYNYYVQNSTATFSIKPLSIDEMRDLVFFDNSKYTTFIIQDNGTICGYVLLAQYKKREAYDGTAEVTIYLRHDFTGKGFGSLAIQFIEEFAGRRNIHALVAIICSENGQSIRLFEKNGYTQCAHYKEVGRKFDRYLDVVCYQKIIH